MKYSKEVQLTQERLKELFHYNPETGEFTRLISMNSRSMEGTITKGCLYSTGYFVIGIYGRRYGVHCLAILYMEGTYPEQVDHIDNNRGNNIYSNLRVCTTSQNLSNACLSSASTTQHKGISFYKNHGKGCYRATVCSEGKSVRKSFSITKFLTKESCLNEAVAWVTNQRNILHGEFVNHG